MCLKNLRKLGGTGRLAETASIDFLNLVGGSSLEGQGLIFGGGRQSTC